MQGQICGRAAAGGGMSGEVPNSAPHQLVVREKSAFFSKCFPEFRAEFGLFCDW